MAPGSTFPVVSVILNVSPSLTFDKLEVKLYVIAGVCERSCMVTFAATLGVMPSSVIVNVSGPSEERSAVTGYVNVSVVPVMKFPVRFAPPMSALCTPVIVNGIVVPALTFVVISVMLNVCPSFACEVDLDNV